MARVHLRRLPADESAVRRYVEELWLPYHRELASAVENHALADDVDVVDEETAHRLERLESDDRRTWVAVEGADDVDGSGFTGAEGVLAGFVATRVERSPSVFDRPDRLIVGDIYVRGAFRGTGLANRLVERTARYAREAECEELVLDVDADNERALAFYDSLGFETQRRRLVVSADEV